MNTLTITLEDKTYLDTYIDLGIQQVIVALKNHTFSALQEFDAEDIEQVVKQAHAKNVQVIAFMNRLYSEQEIYDGQQVMLDLFKTGIDFVMFSDPGLFKCAKEKGLEHRLIYRPETLMTSSGDTKFWYDLGLHSVVIPSLLTKQEMIEIASYVPETTVIIHGSTMMSVSKRKLVSSYQQASGAEFDVHAKTLTLQEKQRDALMPIYENAHATMIYTDYIQESFVEMQDFMDAGVCYYEIDTPFMSQQMILDTIQIYHAILTNKDATNYINSYKKQYTNLSDGYYGQKTVK